MKIAWVVPLSLPACVIVALVVPLKLLTTLKFPFACLQLLTADTDCAKGNKPMVNATNANDPSVLILGFIILLLNLS